MDSIQSSSTHVVKAGDFECECQVAIGEDRKGDFLKIGGITLRLDDVCTFTYDDVGSFRARLRDAKLFKGFVESGEIYFDGEFFGRKDTVNNVDHDELERRIHAYGRIVGLMERLGVIADWNPEDFDQLNIRENIKKIVDIENIRNRGFNTAINSLTSILDTSKMGYQYIENMKNCRELILREYDDTDEANLPDERYEIHMRYFDNAQLLKERQAYEVMIRSFETEVEHLWDVLEIRYEDSKFLTRVTDFNDLAKLYKKKIQKNIKDKTGDPVYEDINKVWDEISFVKVGETEVEKMNRTFIYEKDKIRKRLIIMRDKLRKMYDYQYPVERRVMEERLAFLETEFNKFDYLINPFHLQPGLLLDVDITSIKRKKATLDGMANVLNEFLHGVSKGFQDAAFASFSRRRSTVRTDLAQTFSSSDEDPAAKEPEGRASYLDMLNEEPQAAQAAIPAPADTAAPKRRGRAPAKSAKAGVVDSGRGRRASSSGTTRGRRGMREV